MSHGPVPKRSEQRRRRNKPEGVQVEKAAAGASITWPAPPDSWPDLVTELYEGMQVSGQVRFFEQTDVALARIVLDLLADQMNADKPNGQLVTGLLSQLDALLVSEGARRRVRIELERAVGEDPAEAAAVADFAAYQRKLGG